MLEKVEASLGLTDGDCERRGAGRGMRRPHLITMYDTDAPSLSGRWEVYVGGVRLMVWRDEVRAKGRKGGNTGILEEERKYCTDGYY